MDSNLEASPRTVMVSEDVGEQQLHWLQIPTQAVHVKPELNVI